MTNETLKQLAQIALDSALETMAKKNKTTIENVRQAILLGNENAVSQFKKLNELSFKTMSSMGAL